MSAILKDYNGQSARLILALGCILSELWMPVFDMRRIVMIRRTPLLACITLCFSVFLVRNAVCGTPQRTQVGHKVARKARLLWGFMDKRGEIIVRPRFTNVDRFQGGLACVAIGDKWGYINKTGRIIIPVQFRVAFDFSEGLAAVALPGQKMGYIDKTGKWVIKPRFDNAAPFLGGVASVQTTVSHGHATGGSIDKTGRMVDVKRTFPVAEFGASSLDFSEGLSIFNTERNRKWGYIDTKGHIVIPQQFESAYPFSEGLASVSIDGKRFGFIDKSGRWVIKPSSRWNSPSNFSEGLVGVTANRRVGFIDREGRWAITPKFVSVGDFHEGLAVAYTARKWGYINKRGHWVIVRPVPPVNLDDIGVVDEKWAVHEGMAPVAAKL